MVLPHHSGPSESTDLGPCVEWHEGTSNGYGEIDMYPDKPVRVHRRIMEMIYGPLPSTTHVHHRCGNRLCYLPDHLELIDQVVHGHHHHQRRTHCIHGHEYATFGYARKSNGHQFCRECLRLARLKRYQSVKNLMTCEWCGNQWLARSNARLCSQQCRNRWNYYKGGQREARMAARRTQ